VLTAPFLSAYLIAILCATKQSVSCEPHSPQRCGDKGEEFVAGLGSGNQHRSWLLLREPSRRAVTYLYRSILTLIQFDDPLLLALSIAKETAVMHSTMLPVLTLSPLAQEKAAHL
jgi:hypothetical protein